LLRQNAAAVEQQLIELLVINAMSLVSRLKVNYLSYLLNEQQEHIAVDRSLFIIVVAVFRDNLTPKTARSCHQQVLLNI